MNKYWDWIIGFIAVVALVVGFSAMRQNTVVSVADKVIDRGEIRIGYIVYPPLLSKENYLVFPMNLLKRRRQN